MLLGNRLCKAGHCTKNLSAMRMWYRILPDSDREATRAMLSMYTIRVCHLNSLHAEQIQRFVSSTNLGKMNKANQWIG